MTSVGISKLQKALTEFNKQAITFSKPSEKIVRIDTPFYDRHNDSLIIYAYGHSKNESFTLTDAGYTLDDLESDGIYLTKSPSKLKILKKQLLAYSIQFNDETHEVYTETNLHDYPFKQNLLIQSILFINDMFLVSPKNVRNFFINDVAQFLDANSIRADTNKIIFGSTGMAHTYNFSIAGLKSKRIPSKLIKVINSPTNEYYARSIAMDIHLTRPVVDSNTEFFAVINDTDNSISDNIVSLFESEKMVTIPFSKRNKFKDKLAE